MQQNEFFFLFYCGSIHTKINRSIMQSSALREKKPATSNSIEMKYGTKFQLRDDLMWCIMSSEDWNKIIFKTIIATASSSAFKIWIIASLDCSFSTCIKWHNQQALNNKIYTPTKIKWFNANDIPFEQLWWCDVVAFYILVLVLVDRMPSADHLCMQNWWLRKNEVVWNGYATI